MSSEIFFNSKPKRKRAVIARPDGSVSTIEIQDIPDGAQVQ